MWVVEYDNDTGTSDDCFCESWLITDGNTLFKCNNKEDANWLCNILNSTSPVKLSYSEYECDQCNWRGSSPCPIHHGDNITFTVEVVQFLRPDGRKRILNTELPIEVESAVNDMVSHGCMITVEELMSSKISVTISNEEEDVDIEIVPNSLEVRQSIITMLKRRRWKQLAI